MSDYDDDLDASNFAVPRKWANFGSAHGPSADYEREPRHGRYASDVVDPAYLEERRQIELGKPLMRNCGDSPARLE